MFPMKLREFQIPNVCFDFALSYWNWCTDKLDVKPKVRLCRLFVFIFIVRLQPSGLNKLDFGVWKKFIMILRRLALRSCIENYQIYQYSVRQKSIFQWYNQFWQKFDDPKIEAPYNHCTQIGKTLISVEFNKNILNRIKDSVFFIFKQNSNDLMQL